MNKKQFSKILLKTTKKLNKKLKQEECEIGAWTQEKVLDSKDFVITLWIEFWDKYNKKRYFSKEYIYDNIKSINKKVFQKE